MEMTHKSKSAAAHSEPERAQLVGVLVNAVALLASGIGVITMSKHFLWADILAVLYVAGGATLLLAILTALLRREPSNVTKLREQLVSSYIEAIRGSALAPTHSREHGRA
ncbi:MAG: hypothetical protein ABSD98_09800 [Candidatus Korobacteraceae bacterium]|jgi:hypothetical protein